MHSQKTPQRMSKSYTGNSKGSIQSKNERMNTGSKNNNNPKVKIQIQKNVQKQNKLKKQERKIETDPNKQNNYISINLQQAHKNAIEQFFRQVKRKDFNLFTIILSKIIELKKKKYEVEQQIIFQLMQITKNHIPVRNQIFQIYNMINDDNIQQIQQNITKKNQKSNIHNQIIEQQIQLESEMQNYIPENNEPENNNGNTSTSNSNKFDQQQFLFQCLHANLSDKQYQSIIKIIHIYEIGILNKFQVVDLIKQNLFASFQEYNIFTECISIRQQQRRFQLYYFVPLHEFDLQQHKVTHSYAKIPALYPTMSKVKQKFPQLKNIINSKFVNTASTTQFDRFNIHSKSKYKEELFKNQDEIYLFDLNLYRYKQTFKLLQNLLQTQKVQQAQFSLDQCLKIGVIHSLYKNASIQDKKLIQVCMQQNPKLILRIIKQRLGKQIDTLKSLKEDKLLINWRQTAEKYYQKSLMEIKGFLYKFREEIFIQSHFIYDQIKQIKQSKLPKLCNTFQGLSISQFIHHINPLKLQFQQNKAQNPFLIMYFQNISVFKLTIELINIYLDKSSFNLKSNVKHKIFHDFILKFFQIESNHTELLEKINYQQLLLQIKQYLPIIKKKQFRKVEVSNIQFQLPTKFQSQLLNLACESDKNNKNEKGQQERDLKTQLDQQRIKILLKQKKKMNFLPRPTKENITIYGSILIYELFNLLYKLYQRILRGYQICNMFQLNDKIKNLSREEKIKIAEKRFSVFVSMLKYHTKKKLQPKLEENLNKIFGQISYVFQSIMNILQNLTKVAQSCFKDQFTQASINLFLSQNSQTQQIFHHNIHNYWLNTQCYTDIFRFSYKQNLLYIHNFESIYKKWFIQKKNDQDRQKLLKTARLVQNFTRKKIKQIHLKQKTVVSNQFILKNDMNYTFIPRTKKIISKNEDFLFRKRRRNNFKKQNKIQLNRIHKIMQRLENISRVA